MDFFDTKNREGATMFDSGQTIQEILLPYF